MKTLPDIARQFNDLAYYDEDPINPTPEESALLAKGFRRGVQRATGKVCWYLPQNSPAKARSSENAGNPVPAEKTSLRQKLNSGTRKSKQPSEPERQLREWRDERSKRKEILSYILQPLPIPLGYRCTYRPDAEVHRTDGVTEYIEAKGGFYGKDDRWRSLNRHFGVSLVKLKWLASVADDFTECYLFQKTPSGYWLEHIPSHDEVKLKRRKVK